MLDIIEHHRRTIPRLPPDMADAIGLVLGLGFSYEEAAEACNVATGTMKSRVSRARTILMERLDSALSTEQGAPPPGRPQAA